MATTEDRIGTVRGYSIWQIGLHWLIAALVFSQLVFGESMTEFVEAAEEGEPASALDATIAGVHYYFGIAILALVAVRLGGPCPDPNHRPGNRPRKSPRCQPPRSRARQPPPEHGFSNALLYRRESAFN